MAGKNIISRNPLTSQQYFFRTVEDEFDDPVKESHKVVIEHGNLTAKVR